MHFQCEGSAAIEVKDREAAWLSPRAGPAWYLQRTSSVRLPPALSGPGRGPAASVASRASRPVSASRPTTVCSQPNSQSDLLTEQVTPGSCPAPNGQRLPFHSKRTLSSASALCALSPSCSLWASSSPLRPRPGTPPPAAPRPFSPNKFFPTT